MLFLHAFFALSLGFAFTLAAPTSRSPTVCNGYAELCNRTWSTVSQIGTHDSAFVGTSDTDNQHLSVTQQLNYGVRFLQAQVHEYFGALSMCHTSCLELNAGTLSNYLLTIKEWLDGNPNEVLTLLLVNGDDSNISLFEESFSYSALDSYSYIPNGNPTIDQWPTLGQLIEMDKRIVVFVDSEADTSTVPYISEEWLYFFETAYDVTSAWDFFNCDINRPSTGILDGRMGIVNHFLDTTILFGTVDVPDTADVATTNSMTSINNQVGFCLRDYGYYPKGVLVDFVDKGTPFGSEQFMNGLD